jgi:hypothetical protein
LSWSALETPSVEAAAVWPPVESVLLGIAFLPLANYFRSHHDKANIFAEGT